MGGGSKGSEGTPSRKPISLLGGAGILGQLREISLPAFLIHWACLMWGQAAGNTSQSPAGGTGQSSGDFIFQVDYADSCPILQFIQLV